MTHVIPRLDEVLLVTLAHFDVTFDQILQIKPGRRPCRITMCRETIAWFLHTHCHYSFPETSRALGRQPSDSCRMIRCYKAKPAEWREPIEAKLMELLVCSNKPLNLTPWTASTALVSA